MPEVTLEFRRRTTLNGIWINVLLICLRGGTAGGMDGRTVTLIGDWVACFVGYVSFSGDPFWIVSGLAAELVLCWRCSEWFQIAFGVNGMINPFAAGVMRPFVAGVMRPFVAGVVRPFVAGVVRPFVAGVTGRDHCSLSFFPITSMIDFCSESFYKKLLLSDHLYNDLRDWSYQYLIFQFWFIAEFHFQHIPVHMKCFEKYEQKISWN